MLVRATRNASDALEVRIANTWLIDQVNNRTTNQVQASQQHWSAAAVPPLCWATSNWLQLFDVDIELDPDALMIEPACPKAPVYPDGTGSKDRPGAAWDRWQGGLTVKPALSSCLALASLDLPRGASPA